MLKLSASEFWDSLQKLKNGCWIWQKCLVPSGYGRVTPRLTGEYQESERPCPAIVTRQEIDEARRTA